MSPAPPPCHCGDNPQLRVGEEAPREPRGRQQPRGRPGQLAMAASVGAKDQGVGRILSQTRGRELREAACVGCAPARSAADGQNRTVLSAEEKGERKGMGVPQLWEGGWLSAGSHPPWLLE